MVRLVIDVGIKLARLGAKLVDIGDHLIRGSNNEGVSSELILNRLQVFFATEEIKGHRERCQCLRLVFEDLRLLIANLKKAQSHDGMLVLKLENLKLLVGVAKLSGRWMKHFDNEKLTLFDIVKRCVEPTQHLRELPTADMRDIAFSIALTRSV